MDYVLPFVDCNDPVWQEQYRRVNGCDSFDDSRFRPFDTLKYAFRSVAKNLPFVDRIVLIVSTDSQVPAWVNRETVRIITHDQFMPKQHLPTFSSSAIESDMWRINGLSERFIYGNDDFFALKPMKESDFFDGNLPRLHFEASDYHSMNIFRISCHNGMDMAADAAGHERTDYWTLLKPQHCMKGILNRHMKEVGRICGDKIDQTVTIRRHPWNVTGYIYHYYAYYIGEYADFEKTYKYIRINNDFKAVTDLIDHPQADLLCINDAGDLDQEHYGAACKALAASFEKHFPTECKYELS